MSRRAITACAVTLLCSACASQPPFYGVLIPMPVEADPGVRDTAVDPVLLRQDLKPAFYLEVTTDSETVTPVSFYRHRVVAPEGTLFYGGLFDGEGPVACSFAPIMKGADAFGNDWEQPVCLGDSDEDGAFERFGTLFAGTGANLPVRSGALYGGLMPMEGTVPYRAASYDPADARFDGHTMEAKVRFAPDARRGDTFELVLSDGPFEQGRLLRTVPVPPPDALPATIDLFGAEVEVMSVDDGVVRYRILTSLPEDDVFVLTF